MCVGLPMTRPDINPSNSHLLSQKWLAELLIPTDESEQNAC